ncbi:M23 family metallopeptidase [Novosphingobium sp.]|uniref:M23 family metallopeptidase n=1 Tax=Novosphingobium sp. TaxID=1874826 RepID=UPI0025D8688C|nr:M23 family metallopeptidase [Novosphingobium sp.]
MTWRGPVLVRVIMAALLFGAVSAHSRTPIAPVERRYVVQPGDTFRAIAQRLGVEMEDLGAINGVPPPYIVRIRQALRVPLPRRPEPAPYRDAPRAATKPAKSPVKKPSTAPAVRLAGEPRLIWPTDGAVTGAFDSSRSGSNNGIDLAAYKGMTVRAAAAGRVIFAGHEPERFGLLLVIDHGNGWASAYAYLGDVTVKEGQTVRSGERIARVGASGEARRPTLHFELRHDNVALDPVPYLPTRF